MKLEPIDGQPWRELLPLDDKARRRSNVAPSAPLPITLEALAGGVTLETLQALPVPVLAYSTQITIHGITPQGELPTVAGYKHLTRNGNGSLGVRYGAIDGAKKTLLRHAMYYADKPRKWSAHVASDGLSLIAGAADVAEARAMIAALPSGIYGQTGIMRCPMSGRIYAIAEIGALPQVTLWNIIAHFAPGVDSPEALATREAAEVSQRAAEQAERDAKNAVQAGKAAESREAIRAKALAAGAVRVPNGWKPVAGQWLRITPGTFYAPPAVKMTLAKRGPRLCRLGNDGKWHAITDSFAAQLAAEAQEGFIFHPLAVAA